MSKMFEYFNRKCRWWILSYLVMLFLVSASQKQSILIFFVYLFGMYYISEKGQVFFDYNHNNLSLFKYDSRKLLPVSLKDYKLAQTIYSLSLLVVSSILVFLVRLVAFGSTSIHIEQVVLWGVCTVLYFMLHVKQTWFICTREEIVNNRNYLRYVSFVIVLLWTLIALFSEETHLSSSNTFYYLYVVMSALAIISSIYVLFMKGTDNLKYSHKNKLNTIDGLVDLSFKSKSIAKPSYLTPVLFGITFPNIFNHMDMIFRIGAFSVCLFLAVSFIGFSNYYKESLYIRCLPISKKAIYVSCWRYVLKSWIIATCILVFVSFMITVFRGEVVYFKEFNLNLFLLFISLHLIAAVVTIETTFKSFPDNGLAIFVGTISFIAFFAIVIANITIDSSYTVLIWIFTTLSLIYFVYVNKTSYRNQSFK